MSETKPVCALNLDLSQQISFVRYYKSLPQKPTTTIRLFDRGDYYTAHEEDATFAAQQVFTTSQIKYMGQEPKLSYIVLNRISFEKLVRELLLVRQYRVEVYVKPKQSRNNDWVLEYKGSPGNLSQFEEILFENDDFIFNVSVMGVKLIRNKMLAVSCVDSKEGQFFVNEFSDNEVFTELESVIAQYNPKECIIPQGNSEELQTLERIIERNGCLPVKVKNSEFNADNIFQDLNQLLYFGKDQQKNALALPETNLKDAMCSLQAVIKYLNLTANEQNFNMFKLNLISVHRFVRFDLAANYAFNVFPKETVSQNSSKKYNTVFGVLNMCSTTQGRRLLEQWLKQPLRDINLINERLDIVEALVNNSETRQTLSATCLKRLPDLIMLAKKLSGKKSNLQDCYRVYQAASSIPYMISVLRKPANKYIQSVLVEPLGEIGSDLDKYMAMIEQTIDMDYVDRGEFLIKPSFEEGLKDLHERKQEIEEKMQKALRKAAHDLGLESGKSIKLEHAEQHGYFFRVTLKEEPVLRQNKDYKIIDALNKGVRFTNNKLSDLNESYVDVKISYEDKQKVVIDEVLNVAAGYADTIRNLNFIIAKVDVLQAFAQVAASASIPYVRPKLHKQGSGILQLKKVRHPCVEKQDDVNYIPNDAHFKKDDKLLHIITGPNMGGKSTYIRSVGISVLLAHIGCFVPCEEAEISLVDCILARVGADDALLRGLSTFMLEMVETSVILRSATSDSLVVIDELGRGTSTYDGCGIAYAVAKHLASVVKCFTLFATHFHEITELAEMLPTVNNLHVTAVTMEKTITPLFQVRPGATDKSFGIHCAKMADFPPDVIEFALKHLEHLENARGMKYIRDYEISLKRSIVQEANTLVHETLEKCKKLKNDNLSDEDLIKTLHEYKASLLSTGNLFIKGLLEQ